MTAFRTIPWLLVSMAAGTAGCGGRSADEDRVLVFAAASTTEIVSALARGHARVQTSFASSSALARQIQDGAPASVYISADRRWIDVLRASGDLGGDPVRLCRNRLVCITASGSHLAARPPRNVLSLVHRLEEGEVVAIADAGVPAGEYARASLKHGGAETLLARRAVGQSDVRGVLHAVRSRQAVAGFVYATDARLGGVVSLFTCPEESHEPIVYWAALTASGIRSKPARDFLNHLTSPKARRLLEAAAFTVTSE